MGGGAASRLAADLPWFLIVGRPFDTIGERL
jgi:hypothetical protein